MRMYCGESLATPQPPADEPLEAPALPERMRELRRSRWIPTRFSDVRFSRSWTWRTGPTRGASSIANSASCRAIATPNVMFSVLHELAGPSP